MSLSVKAMGAKTPEEAPCTPVLTRLDEESRVCTSRGLWTSINGSRVKNTLSSQCSLTLLLLAFFVLFNITQQVIPGLPARSRLV